MGWCPTVSDTDCFFLSAFCSWDWITSVNLCSSSLILLPAQILSLWIFHFSHCTFQILEFLFDSFYKFRSLYSLKKKISFGCTAQHVGSKFPNQGSNPHPLHWQQRVLTTGLGKSQMSLLILFEESLAKGRIFPLVLWIHWKRNCFFCY